MNAPRKPTLDDNTLQRLAAPLRAANLAHAAAYPGDPVRRQPVHTVYGGAHLFRHDVAAKLGAAALKSLDEYAPDERSFGTSVQVSGLASSVFERVRAKLAREPVEDYRIDFEDGYGTRPEGEEDEHAVSAARELGRGMREGTLPRGVGIRIKPLGEATRRRAVRTLDFFLSELTAQTGGALPDGFVVTLPKPTLPEQVTALSDLLEALEARLQLPSGVVKLELMVELPQALFDARGVLALPALVRAARGRCVAAHFGTYDYTAALGVAAPHQAMRHPACDFARHVMQVSLAGTGVAVSDGATNVLPVAPFRAAPGAALDDAQRARNAQAVQHAWALHFGNVRDSLARGIYQGWDLHPAQLPVRYAAVYDFLRSAAENGSAERLRNFVERAGQATRVGAVFDDAATGQGLLNVFVRAVDCGAMDEAEAERMTAIPVSLLRTRSFPAIVASVAGAAGQLPR